jgi:hypothetical protein
MLDQMQDSAILQISCWAAKVRMIRVTINNKTEIRYARVKSLHVTTDRVGLFFGHRDNQR